MFPLRHTSPDRCTLINTVPCRQGETHPCFPGLAGLVLASVIVSVEENEGRDLGAHAWIYGRLTGQIE